MNLYQVFSEAYEMEMVRLETPHHTLMNFVDTIGSLYREDMLIIPVPMMFLIGNTQDIATESDGVYAELYETPEEAEE